MTEERVPYHADPNADPDLDGVMRIGDVIRQLLDRGELPTPPPTANGNGHRPNGEGRNGHE